MRLLRHTFSMSHNDKTKKRLQKAENDGNISLRHCEERSDEAISYYYVSRNVSKRFIVNSF
ncbi:MAG: hypothetical protein WAW45_01540 [Atribacterota bacterium]